MLVFSRNVPVIWTEIREHIEIIDSNKLSGWENIKKKHVKANNFSVCNAFQSLQSLFVQGFKTDFQTQIST